MTNEEIALEKINDLIDDCNDGKYVKGTDCDCIQYPCRLYIIKNSIQENTKLKAEIEQLKDILNIRNKENMSLLLQRKGLEVKIEQLKSELEQSVKLPCSQWNLCVDKMPSVITGNYIVCLENEAIMMANYFAFSNKFREISTMGMRDFYDDNKVVAWMELPQSLKGKLEE